MHLNFGFRMSNTQMYGIHAVLQNSTRVGTEQIHYFCKVFLPPSSSVGHCSNSAVTYHSFRLSRQSRKASYTSDLLFILRILKPLTQTYLCRLTAWSHWGRKILQLYGNEQLFVGFTCKNFGTCCCQEEKLLKTITNMQSWPFRSPYLGEQQLFSGRWQSITACNAKRKCRPSILPWFTHWTNRRRRCLICP